MIITDLSTVPSFTGLPKNEGNAGVYPPTWFQPTRSRAHNRVVTTSSSISDEVEPDVKKRNEWVHKNYIDIQYPILQDETMGWTALSDLNEPESIAIILSKIAAFIHKVPRNTSVLS